jgi:hypothetical protein
MENEPNLTAEHRIQKPEKMENEPNLTAEVRMQETEARRKNGKRTQC